VRTDRSALRVARQHDRLAAREPDLDGPGLDISQRLDTQANRVRRLADGGRECADAGAAPGSLALAPETSRERAAGTPRPREPCGRWR